MPGQDVFDGTALAVSRGCSRNWTASRGRCR